jgi:hypothetical protein
VGAISKIKKEGVQNTCEHAADKYRDEDNAQCDEIPVTWVSVRNPAALLC